MNNESVTLNKILNGLIYVCWIHQETNKNHREKNYWRNNGKKITISVKNTDFKIQEAQQTSSRINTNKGITFWSSVQFSLSVCPILCNPMNRSIPGLPVHHKLPEFTQTHAHWVSDAIQPSHPLSSPSPPVPSPSKHQGLSSIRVFSEASTLHVRWPKYWSFSFSISPSNEHTGLISFKVNWLDLLAVQGTLKSLLQHHSSKALIFQCSAFFTVQLSHPYMTTGTTIALTKRTLLAK